MKKLEKEIKNMTFEKSDADFSNAKGEPGIIGLVNSEF